MPHTNKHLEPRGIYMEGWGICQIRIGIGTCDANDTWLRRAKMKWFVWEIACRAVICDLCVEKCSFKLQNCKTGSLISSATVISSIRHLIALLMARHHHAISFTFPYTRLSFADAIQRDGRRNECENNE